jgi:hypothetical protein
MPLPASAFATTCEIRRPFGGDRVALNVPCSLKPRLAGQRIGGDPPPLFYTHVLTLDPDADVRDGCSRAPGSPRIDFDMGDEVRVPSGDDYGAKYAVVWVEVENRGLAVAVKRVYLTRDEVRWGTRNAP